MLTLDNDDDDDYIDVSVWARSFWTTAQGRQRQGSVGCRGWQLSIGAFCRLVLPFRRFGVSCENINSEIASRNGGLGTELSEKTASSSQIETKTESDDGNSQGDFFLLCWIIRTLILSLLDIYLSYVLQSDLSLKSESDQRSQFAS